MGCGAPVAGIFHLITHACFKAMLFLGSGSVIHAMEEVVGHQPVLAQDTVSYTHLTLPTT